MNHKNNQYYISLGEIIICINSQIPLQISQEIKNFCVNKRIPDVTIHVKYDQKQPLIPTIKCGEDILINYYQDEHYQYAVAKTGYLEPVTIVKYPMDLSEFIMFVNEKEHPNTVRSPEKILQLFPLRQLLTKYHAMVLHSSQIALGSKGILFTAPSGTGKSTQAKLWEKYENASIVCNDRTLLRKKGNLYETYGYPIDGASPIYSNRKLNLGAIVVLQQGSENCVNRLSVSKSLKYLMEQTVLDIWDKNEFMSLRTEWLNVIEHYPVYLLTCRPDLGAVECLKQHLKREGVI